MLFRFPFNTQITIGYIIAVVFQFITVTFAFLFAACMATTAFSALIFLIALVKDLKANLKLINKMGKHRNRHSKIYESIIRFIDLHSDVRELSGYLNYIRLFMTLL